MRIAHEVIETAGVLVQIDHRRDIVVGAVDGDGDELAGGAVAGDGGEAVGDRLAGAELLDRGLAVVGGVGPVAGGIEREGAEAVAAGVLACGGEIGLALIDVGDGQRAAGGQVAGDVTATSSVTAPVLTPPITGTSLVPLMVTVTSWLAVPSLETAVKLSVIDWPAPSCWIAVWLSSAV